MQTVIMTDTATAEFRDAITKYVEEKGVKSWHWLPDSWMIFSPEPIDVTTWRDEIKILCPRLSFFVISFESHRNWAGVLPEESHEWIQKYF
jgi:hypothetical protein